MPDESGELVAEQPELRGSRHSLRTASEGANRSNSAPASQDTARWFAAAITSSSRRMLRHAASRAGLRPATSDGGLRLAFRLGSVTTVDVLQFIGVEFAHDDFPVVRWMKSDNVFERSLHDKPCGRSRKSKPVNAMSPMAMKPPISGVLLIFKTPFLPV